VGVEGLWYTLVQANRIPRREQKEKRNRNKKNKKPIQSEREIRSQKNDENHKIEEVNECMYLGDRTMKCGVDIEWNAGCSRGVGVGEGRGRGGGRETKRWDDNMKDSVDEFKDMDNENRQQR